MGPTWGSSGAHMTQVGHVQGRIQDLKLGVAQMETDWKNRGGGGGAYFFIVYISNMIYFKFAF